MASPLRLRLLAEALGTFLFFFLGFNAIAVSKDLGSGAISTSGSRSRSAWPCAGDHRARSHLRRTLQPRRVARPRHGAEVPGERGGPVLDRAARRRVRRVLAVAAVYSGPAVDALVARPARNLERGRAPARADRDGPVRDRDLHRRHGRPRAVEGRHGAAADRALHLHGGGRDRPRFGRLVQSGEIARSAIFNWDFSKIWIYLVGPLAGGMIGGAIWICSARPGRRKRPRFARRAACRRR